MHARPFEHNNADHDPGGRKTEGEKEDKEYDPRKKITCLKTRKKNRG
jgi:hypothetical protein